MPASTSFTDIIISTVEATSPVSKEKTHRLPPGAEFIDQCQCGGRVNGSAIAERRYEKIGEDSYRGICNICFVGKPISIKKVLAM